MTAETPGAAEPGTPRTMCPYCGTDTGIARRDPAVLGHISLDEFETLVRNEWRRRLGRRAYRRRHRRLLVRGLLELAIRPDDPVRERVADRLLAAEVERMRAHGLGAVDVELEMLRLSQATWDILSTAGLDLGVASGLMERIDRKLLGPIAGAAGSAGRERIRARPLHAFERDP